MVPVFDGSEIQTAISVSAVIGKQKVLRKPKHDLLSGTYWPIRMAFFSPGHKSIRPTHEMTINLHENGIADNLVLDYSDFTVNMKLVKVEEIAPPHC
ncbi:MAG: EipB family protein [Thalassobaculaceae bacterium]